MSRELPAGGSPGRLRVLVVDDNPDMLETVSIVLSYMGHDVSVAHNGEDALSQMQAEPPQVVLLDVGMPVLDGYATASRARDLSARADMYLIAMTGWGRDEDKARAIDSGFDAHITKPFEMDDLRAVLASLRFPR